MAKVDEVPLPLPAGSAAQVLRATRLNLEREQLDLVVIHVPAELDSVILARTASVDDAHVLQLLRRSTAELATDEAVNGPLPAADGVVVQEYADGTYGTGFVHGWSNDHSCRDLLDDLCVAVGEALSIGGPDW